MLIYLIEKKEFLDVTIRDQKDWFHQPPQKNEHFPSGSGNVLLGAPVIVDSHQASRYLVTWQWKVS